MMNRVISLFTVLLITTGAVGAQTFKKGVGIVLGEPTGITFKYHINPVNAIDTAAAWSLDGNRRLHLQADYLYHNDQHIKVSKGRLPIFYGIGGRVEFREDERDSFGVRIPIGLDYYFAGAPFDIYGAVVPVLEIIPSTDFTLEAAIGFRFWF